MSVKGISSENIIDIQRIKDRQSQETSPDRDPNGQAQSGQQEKKKFNEEEIKFAVKQLKKLEGIKSNNLDVKYEKKGYIFVVYVTDMTGKVIRRIPEQDLVQYLKQDDAKPSGHIYNKYM